MTKLSTRRPTFANVRAEYKRQGKEVRISREGRVEFCEPAGQWLEGRWVGEYRFVAGQVVLA